MTRRLPLAALLVIIDVVAVHAADSPRYFKTGVLTPEDRVWAQTQIERVWYRHRTWPRDNPGAKPPFAATLPDAVIRERAAEPLRQSAALERLWNDPVRDTELQRELARMIRESRDPATLRELFAALHDDPFLIAETLVRESLAERRLRARFAADRERHGEALALARAAYARSGEAGWSRAAGDYRRLTWVRGDRARRPDAGGDELPLDDAEFTAQADGSPAPGAVSPLRESAEGFWFTRTIRKSSERLESETLFFAKPDFEAWWRAARGDYDGAAARDSRRDPGGFSLAGSDGRLVAAGGCDVWAPIAPFADQPQVSTPTPRYSHSAVWTGSEMIVWGGFSTSGAVNDGARYTPATDSWLATATAGAPAARAQHTAVWTGSVMVIWGGTQSGSGPYYNSGGRYSPAFDTWAATSTGANAPAARASHTVVWTGSVMVVWGGRFVTCPSSCTTTYFGDGGRYDPSADAWAPVLTPGPAERILHSAVWTGTYMVVFGGYNLTGGPYTEFNNGGRYDPVGNSWLPLSATNAPQTVEGHTAVWSGSRMIVWGGNHNGNQQINGGSRYDPAGDVWYPMSTIGAPVARDQHVAVWSSTASVMVVWGGYPSYTAVNTGGRYDPALDQWTATATAGAPPPARQPSAVWSPERGEMLVWGGQDGSSASLNSGGRYNPVTNSWSQIPVFDGVNTRADHSAIWTGAEMIIWGGLDASYLRKNTGGRYLPATNAWSPLSVIGAPARRSNHAAVWTGSTMVIYGNSGVSGPGNTGGRYYPATNSWLSTSTGGGAPVYDRSNIAMVWTGSRVVIWGGYGFDGTQYASLGTGYRYDPVNDTWASVALTNAPSARESAAVVWTGTQMLVWGGSYHVGSTYTYYANGGRYDPVADVWSAMNVAGAPSARAGHSFAWAGGYLSVLNGADNSSSFTNGGRYNAAADGWLAMSTSGMPGPRGPWGAAHSPSTFFLWSGDYIANGFRYDPSADVWAAMNTAGQPVARTEQAGVWIGNGVLYWGGRTSASPYMTNGGGIYLFGPDSPGATLRAAKSSTLDLSWTAASGATNYNVKRCTGSGAFCNPTATVATPAGNGYSEALDGNSYFYAVEAVNACGATP